MPRDNTAPTPAMMSATQKTLSRAVSCAGEGVHTSQMVTLTLHPAPAGHGIVFERTDVAAPNNQIRALWDNVHVSPLCTQIRNASGTEVRTIEHLMAALYSSGIDNVLVTLDGAEVPILDGSAQPFFDMIAQAGVTSLGNPRRFIKILKKVEVSHKDATASLEPADAPSFAISVAYPQHKIGEQQHALDFDDASFSEIASARTFGFETELEYLRTKGLTLGGSLENAILINRDGGVVNPEGYRYENELARHKLLDAIGDLSLAGVVIIGHFNGNRSGHALNNALLHAVFADATAWIEIDDVESTPLNLPAALAAGTAYSG